MALHHFSSVARAAAIAAVVAALCHELAMARTCTATSGSSRTALLELYTSQGCDSCPPADKWVSELAAKNFGAARVIALAFHVDYWNYIGWTDPFAQTHFSDRQLQQNRRRSVNFVFTPQLLLNGQDYRRGLLADNFQVRVSDINRSGPLADIRLTLSANGATLTGAVEAITKSPELRSAQLYLALYENNLVTTVTSGENKGRTLKNDYVVRELNGPISLNADGGVRYEHTFSINPQWKFQDLAVSAFVQHPQSGDILQAMATACH